MMYQLSKEDIKGKLQVFLDVFRNTFNQEPSIDELLKYANEQYELQKTKFRERQFSDFKAQDFKMLAEVAQEFANLNQPKKRKPTTDSSNKVSAGVNKDL